MAKNISVFLSEEDVAWVLQSTCASPATFQAADVPDDLKSEVHMYLETFNNDLVRAPALNIHY